MFLSLLFRISSSLLSLRYRISFKNIEVFDSGNPVLVFPNHPALVDPLILISNIWKKKLLSPVMTETYFHTPGLGGIVRALETVSVWDIAAGGTIEDVKKAFAGIEAAMNTKKSILIYPSGHIYVQPFEHIVGKKMAYEMVGMLTWDTRIIVTRTKWLWGSMWGKSYTGKSPELMKTLMKSIGYILANGIFFVPKRDVTIEFVDMTDRLLEWHTLGLDTFNQNLQDFYNEWGNEICRFIPHYFYHNDVEWKTEPQNIVGSIAEINSWIRTRREDISDEVYEIVHNKIAEIKKLEKDTFHFESNLILELHADSLDMAELKSAIQSLFPEASNPPIGLIKTVWDLAAMATWMLKWEEKLREHTFIQALSEKIEFSYQKGDTILTLFKKNFKNEKKSPFVYDAMTGMMTHDEFLLKSYVIGQYIQKYKTPKIGIMLPALSATSLLLVWTYLSGKLPVMLNWTVGEKSFAHCMNFAGLDVILTSRKFYEKISSSWLAEFEEKMIFIEDIIRDISLSDKIIAVIKKTLFLLPKTWKDAVMLFTSGSESLPKAVVLSHENILSDIEWALHHVPFQKYETLLGFLPPFHSFGFTLNTIFPLIAPVQVAYTPDPNDAKTIGRILSYTHTSIVSATPTFLRMILANNDRNTLDSLRFAFVGAEKCSDEVFSLYRDKCPSWTMLEWYGITECSPIVTVNTIDTQKRWSAGKFLPQVQYLVRSLDNTSTMNSWEQWMIYVAGPSIFEWYLDSSLDSPFDEIDGKLWYKTGDLGYVDTDGFLFITGRLKRFVKIAGEMISLPFIEGILIEKYGNSELTTLAIEAKEESWMVTIVAFTTFDVSSDELNDYIHSHWASNLVKISKIERLESIPVLGTGKTDYKQLKSKI
jgi:acyl-CoA synthetase (AMP-forming)/AMP-acid ligase II/1-acyl-sn-glycerol-3-phosphate acyltransferase/acyl carrier protein